MSYDPDAIVAACLAEMLNDLTDLDGDSIIDICDDAELELPDDGDDGGWSVIGSKLAELAGRIHDDYGAVA